MAQVLKKVLGNTHGNKNSYLVYNNIGTKIFYMFLYIILFFVVVVTLYPFLYVLSVSISNIERLNTETVVLMPLGFSLDIYGILLDNSLVIRAYLNTILYAFSGVAFSIFLLIITAYPLSLNNFRGKKPIMVFFTITMFFSGGMIPSYLLIRELHMINTIWALILPGCLGVTNIIILRVNFQSIPVSLTEAAFIEGAGHISVLFKIILPLSLPIIATLSLFIIVGHWNSYFGPLLYISDMKKQPLQIILRDILVQDAYKDIVNDAGAGKMEQATPIGIKRAFQAGAIIVSTGPILLVYPFIQKYFVKGALVGSIKG